MQVECSAVIVAAVTIMGMMITAVPGPVMEETAAAENGEQSHQQYKSQNRSGHLYPSCQALMFLYHTF